MAQIDFDANQVEPGGDFNPVPGGDYEVVISDSETVTNKSKNGSHLKLTMMIVKGEHERRFLWDRLNLDNPSQDAVNIARGTLSRICRAVGVMVLKDTSQLHNLPIIVRVVQQEKNGVTYNRIKGYFPRQNGQTFAPAPAVNSAPATAPWAKK